MEAVYPFALIIHLFCAIVFVGYLIVEFLFFTPLFKRIPKEWSEKIHDILGGLETKIMPPSLLLLVLSGGMMISQYVGGEGGYFASPMQALLTIKMILGLCIFALASFSLTMYYVFKKPNPIGKYVHPIALALSLVIVLLAKLAFIIG